MPIFQQSPGSAPTSTTASSTCLGRSTASPSRPPLLPLSSSAAAPSATNSDEAMMELVGCSLRMSSCLFKNCHSTAGSDLISAGDADPLQLHLRGRIDRWFCCRDCRSYRQLHRRGLHRRGLRVLWDTTVYRNVSNADGGHPTETPARAAPRPSTGSLTRTLGTTPSAVDQHGTAAYLDEYRPQPLQFCRHAVQGSATSSSARARASRDLSPCRLWAEGVRRDGCSGRCGVVAERTTPAATTGAGAGPARGDALGHGGWH